MRRSLRSTTHTLRPDTFPKSNRQPTTTVQQMHSLHQSIIATIFTLGMLTYSMTMAFPTSVTPLPALSAAQSPAIQRRTHTHLLRYPLPRQLISTASQCTQIIDHACTVTNPFVSQDRGKQGGDGALRFVLALTLAGPHLVASIIITKITDMQMTRYIRLEVHESESGNEDGNEI